MMWLLSSSLQPTIMGEHIEKIPEKVGSEPARIMTRGERKRRKAEKEIEREVKMKVPLIRKQYLANSGHVDQANSSILSCRYPHPLGRWKTALLFWLLGMAVHNARILYTWKGTAQSQAEFLEKLSQQLSPRKEEVFDRELHQPIQGKKGTHGQCSVCRKKGLRSTNTTVKCSVCQKFIHTRCFDKFEHALIAIGK